MCKFKTGTRVIWCGYGKEIKGTFPKKKKTAGKTILILQDKSEVPWQAKKKNGSWYAFSGTDREGNSTFTFLIRKDRRKKVWSRPRWSGPEYL